MAREKILELFRLYCNQRFHLCEICLKAVESYPNLFPIAGRDGLVASGKVELSKIGGGLSLKNLPDVSFYCLPTSDARSNCAILYPNILMSDCLKSIFDYWKSNVKPLQPDIMKHYLRTLRDKFTHPKNSNIIDSYKGLRGFSSKEKIPVTIEYLMDIAQVLREEIIELLNENVTTES